MYWTEILFGFYAFVALIVWSFVFFKLISDRDELSAFSFLEQTVLIFIWFMVSGTMGICWPIVLVVAVSPRIFAEPRKS